MSFEIETINKLIVLFIVILCITLGGGVLLVNRKGILNKRFALMALASLFWVIFAYLGFSAETQAAAIFWYKLNVISTLLTALTFYAFFILSFLKEEGKHRIFNKIILVYHRHL